MVVDNQLSWIGSEHLPAGYTDDLFAALELQEEPQIKYTGGTVFPSQDISQVIMPLNQTRQAGITSAHQAEGGCFSDLVSSAARGR